MRFDIVTLFPDCFTSVLNSGLIGKALAKQIANVHFVNPRDFTTDKHRKVDDEPYGGGVGMLMKPGPIFSAVESLPTLQRREVIMMSPQGETINQPLLRELAGNYDQIVIICGHYEGVDERVLELVTREVSLGDFILTGGEIPSMALINGVVRLLPGTVGIAESLKLESFEEGLLDFPPIHPSRNLPRPQSTRCIIIRQPCSNCTVAIRATNCQNPQTSSRFISSMGRGEGEGE